MTPGQRRGEGVILREDFEMAKKPYIALTPIDYNGEHYEPQEPIELDDKLDAPALLAVKAIEPAPAADKTKAKA